MVDERKKMAQIITILKEQNIIELQEGDCIHCGELCLPSIYGCTEPSPITKEEAEAINEKGGYKKPISGCCCS